MEDNDFVTKALKDDRVQSAIAQIVQAELERASNKHTANTIRNEKTTPAVHPAKLHLKIELMETVITDLKRQVEGLKNECERSKVSGTQKDKQLEQLTKEKFHLSSLLGGLHQKDKQLEQLRKEKLHLLGDLQATMKLKDIKFKKLQQELDSMSDEHEASLEKIRAENAKLTEEIEDKTLRIIDLENSLAEKCKSLDDKIEELKSVTEENKSLESTVAVLKQNNTSSEENLNKLKTESESLQKSISELEQQLKLAQSENLVLKNELQQMSSLVNDNGDHINSSKKRKRTESVSEKDYKLSESEQLFANIDNEYSEDISKDVEPQEVLQPKDNKRQSARMRKPGGVGSVPSSEDISADTTSKSIVQRKPVGKNVNSKKRILERKKQKSATCSLCSETFANLSALLRHTKHHHKKQSQRQSKSARPQAKPKNASDDDDDTSVEHGIPTQDAGYGESLHFCKCGNSYKSKKERSRHFLKMSTGKLFRCPECNNRYYSTTSLRRHMKNRHKQIFKGFGCRTCGEIFEIMKDLKLHRDIKH